MIHDERVDRVTGGQGRVADLTLEELRSLRVFGTDQRVPTLEAVVEAVPPDASLNVELKEDGVAADAVRTLEAHDGDVLYTSFRRAALSGIREAAPSAPTAYISGKLRRRPVATARRLGSAAVHLNVPLCLVPGLVALAHHHGLQVNAWTVNRPALARLLGWIGVDGMTVDGRHAIPDPVALSRER